MKQVSETLDDLEATLRQKSPISSILDEIMADLGGRAIGLWRCEAGSLIQVGFRAVEEMDEQVREQFASFTQKVSLENTGLGIVKAVTDQEPAIGTLQPEQSGLKGSSEWLVKFGAQQSYAVPICEGAQSTGVLAISTAGIHQEGDQEWEILTQLAEGIGERKLLGVFWVQD